MVRFSLKLLKWLEKATQKLWHNLAPLIWPTVIQMHELVVIESGTNSVILAELRQTSELQTDAWIIWIQDDKVNSDACEHPFKQKVNNENYASLKVRSYFMVTEWLTENKNVNKWLTITNFLRDTGEFAGRTECNDGSGLDSITIFGRDTSLKFQSQTWKTKQTDLFLADHKEVGHICRAWIDGTRNVQT